MTTIRTYGDIKNEAKNVEQAAIEAWAEELDEKGFTKGEQDLSDWFGANDFSADDLANTFAWIPNFMLGSCGADPEKFDDIIEDLKATAKKLDTDEIPDIQERIRGCVEDWEGDGATQFKRFWLPTWAVSRYQGLLVTSMITNLTANRELLIQARSDIYDVACMTTYKLEEYTGWGAVDGTSTLKIFDLLVNVSLTIVPAPVKVPAMIGLVVAQSAWSETKSSLQKKFDKDEDGLKIEGGEEGKVTGTDYKISGGSVKEILDCMIEAVTDISKKIDEKEQEIADQLQQAYDEISTKGRDLFQAPRPDITDTKDSELTSDKGLGEPG